MVDKAILHTVFLLGLFSCPFVLAQESRDPFQGIPLNSEQKQEIVKRMIQWHFAPRSQPIVVPLLKDGIDPAWLPNIANVNFRLVDLHQIGEFDRDIRYFHTLENDGRTFFISLAKGDPECHASGNTWAFRVDRGRVRLWPLQNAGWGTGCGGSRIPPTIPNLQIGYVSPNELPGYQFFKTGKLRTIRLGTSRREDLAAIFGKSCESPCDYDEDWFVWVNYFEKDNCGVQTIGDEETRYCPKGEYVGTLSFIRLTPKKQISFLKFEFPRVFYKGESYTIGDSFSEKGFEGAVHTTITYYEDSYGLKYELYGRETFRNIPGRSDSKEGDLLGIQYEIPQSFDSGVFNALRQK